MKVYPATSRQHWYWQAQADALVTPVLIRLDHTTDPRVLQAALHDLAARHEALRTRLHCVRGVLRQTVCDPPALNFASPVTVGQHGLWRALFKTVGITFTLREGVPLARATLIAAGAQRVLALVVHRAVCDPWAAEIVADDLIELVTAHAQGRTPQLPPLPAQFGHYARAESQLQPDHHWHDRLRSGNPRLRLRHTDRAPGRFRGLRVEITADCPTGAGAAMTSTLAGALVVAAFWPYLGDEITLGWWVANRTPSRLRRVVGDLADLLPVRVNLTGAPTFTELHRRVHAAYLDALAHPAPSGRLAEFVRTNPDRNHGPLFDIGLECDTTRIAAPARPGPRRLDYPMNMHSYTLNTWWDGHPPVDVRLRPHGDDGFTGGLLVNVAWISDENARKLATRLNTLRWRDWEPARRPGRPRQEARW